ncbi:MAG: YncE family protein [candidate division WOR-3 bacterium]
MWNGGTISFGYNPGRNVIYVTSDVGPDSILVIDVIRDTVLKSFSSHRSKGLCYAGSYNRLYFGSDMLYVADGNTDSIVREIEPPLSGYDFLRASWDSVAMKLYISLFRWNYPNMMAVYNAGDSLVALFPLPNTEPVALQFHYRLGKAYFSGYLDDFASVVDTKNDTFIRWFPIAVQYAGLVPFALDTIDNKFYCARARQEWPDTLYVIDCFTDSIVKKIVEAGWGPLSVRWASWNNRLYFTGGPRGETLKVLDCRTDSVIGRLYLHQYGLTGPPHLILDPDRRRIFAVGRDSSLYVLREVVPGVEQRGEKGFNRLEPTIVRNILYLPDTGDPGYVLLDITGSRVRELKSGANDVRSVAPGVYFIREDSAVVRKVVIAH